MKPKLVPGVPTQLKGGFHDTECRREFESEIITTERFSIVTERFFAINNWRNYCGKNSADFKLFDAFGNPVNRTPAESDLIRIDIPGPGNVEAGFDWAKINKISRQFIKNDEIENLVMICSPTKNPENKKNNNIAHFYSPSSSSIFMISRGKTYIQVGIYGRNETPNFINAGFTDKIRNSMIAIGGILGMSKFEWKCTAEGMIVTNGLNSIR